MVGLPGLFAIIGALNLMLLGGASGGRYGLLAALCGGAVGGVLGLLFGFGLGLFAEESGRWLTKLAKKRPLAEAVVRIAIFILLVAFLGADWLAMKRFLLLPLKERVRVQSAMAAQERLARGAPTNTNHPGPPGSP